MLKFCIDDPAVWTPAFVWLNINSSSFKSVWYDDIPLNPRVRPVNVFVVSPVYVIISLSIFNNPYWLGNPFVLETDKVSTVCVLIPTDNVGFIATTSGVKLSRLRYWSKFSAISTTPLWYSCEI